MAKEDKKQNQNNKLISKRMDVLIEARQAQVELSKARLQLSSIDKKLNIAGISDRDLACW